MDFGRLTFSSGGEQMLLFGGAGAEAAGFFGGSPAVGVSGVEDWRCNRRPFLAAAAAQEELQLEEELELYEAAAPERKRRLTAEQVRALERSFEEEKRKLEPERKSELAARLGIAPRQVAVWFQNRRARWRAKQLELDFDRLRTAHDELLAGRDALLADNDRLQSQVMSLTEKLQSKAGSPPALAPASEPEPDDQTTASATAAPATAAHAAAIRRAAVQPEEGTDHVCAAEASNGGANGSPESYFAGARSPPSSSEEDCCCCGGGGAGDERCAFFLPDAVLDATAEEAAAAHLSNWAWFWD